MSLTPFMRQYADVKKEHQDSILLFRMGDFYEMFYEDAEIASKVLGIALTARNKEKDSAPMAGVPFHAAQAYISKLIDAGYKVAICEQLESSKNVKGIVKRGVVKIVTPGTFSDPDYVDAKSNKYIVSFCLGDNGSSLAFLDLTTSVFKTTQFNKDESNKALNEIFRLNASEIILGIVKDKDVKERLELYAQQKRISLSHYLISPSLVEEYLKEYFQVNSLEVFDIHDKKYSQVATATILEYLAKLQNTKFINKISYYNMDKFLVLDHASQTNLDVFGNNSLYKAIDNTKSAMGARFLKHALAFPLVNLEEIREKQDEIEYYINNTLTRSKISSLMKEMLDIERAYNRVLRNEANIRDLNAIKKSLLTSLKINEILSELKHVNLISILNFSKLSSKATLNDFDTDKIFGKDKISDIDLLEEFTFLDQSVLESNALSIREGNIINPNVDEELKELHMLSNNVTDLLLELEQRERDATGIKNLKIKYSNVFGYVIEITNSYLKSVPEGYVRRQTISNAERFVTEELKVLESRILNAKDKICEIEFRIFNEICEKMKKNRNFYDHLSKAIAYLDFVVSLSEVAIKNKYCRPIMNSYTDRVGNSDNSNGNLINSALDNLDSKLNVNNSNNLVIKNGRHPIVEQLVSNFIVNDSYLKDSEIIILTGPNMSGKSTYMKQVALICLLAHTGSFVPAEYAEIPIMDRIFTRVGASDDLATGQSTFMVEMNEVARILNEATNRSLVILDEVGRGTSTYDGISIAKATTEYIHDNIHAKTIFATHYHELNELEGQLENVLNYRFEVKEYIDRIEFLKKIVPGGADKSYGLEVARLAGLPKSVLQRAKQLLSDLELKREMKSNMVADKDLNSDNKRSKMNSLFDKKQVNEKTDLEISLNKELQKNLVNRKILLNILEIDLNHTTPAELYTTIAKIQKEIES